MIFPEKKFKKAFKDASKDYEVYARWGYLEKETENKARDARVKCRLGLCVKRLRVLEACGRGFERQELTREIKVLKWVLLGG